MDMTPPITRPCICMIQLDPIDAVLYDNPAGRMLRRTRVAQNACSPQIHIILYPRAADPRERIIQDKPVVGLNLVHTPWPEELTKA